MLAFVVEKFSKLLWKIAASILINAASVQDVEECIADEFIYLWQHPEKYDPDKAKLSLWFSMEEIVTESLGYNAAMTADEEKEEILSCIDGPDEKEKDPFLKVDIINSF